MVDELLKVGLTQTEIADAIGCQQSYISKLHRGAVSRISFDLGSNLATLHRRHRRRIRASVNGGGNGKTSDS